MTSTLFETLERVNDPATFLVFAKALYEDRSLNEDEWKNGSIEQFLERAHAWGDTTKLGESQGIGDRSPWYRCAVFLYCGKIYE